MCDNNKNNKNQNENQNMKTEIANEFDTNLGQNQAHKNLQNNKINRQNSSSQAFDMSDATSNYKR